MINITSNSCYQSLRKILYLFKIVIYRNIITYFFRKLQAVQEIQ